MSTGHPVTHPQFSSVELRVAFWALALLVYMICAVPYGLAFDRLWSRFVGTPIPLLLLTTPLLMFALGTTAWGMAALFEPSQTLWDVLTWQMVLRTAFVAHVFETTAILWLLPAQRARSVTTRAVTLAGKRIAVQDIGRVKAAEHYLEVHLRGEVQIFRERMGTFLDQVTHEDGVQTHRSHWVSRGSARSLSGSMLTLECGRTVPVARGRLKDVRDWMARMPERPLAPRISQAQQS